MPTRSPKAGVALMAQARDFMLLESVGMVLCDRTELDCKYFDPLLNQHQTDLGPKQVTDCTHT
jgi:hypothetical protein